MQQQIAQNVANTVQPDKLDALAEEVVEEIGHTIGFEWVLVLMVFGALAWFRKPLRKLLDR